MDALVNKVPLALDTAGRATSQETAMVASGHSTEAERIDLAVQQGVHGERGRSHRAQG